MTSPVTPARVREIIAAYGAAAQRWPESERQAALALLASDPALAQLREEARDLDDLLDAQPAPPTVQVNPVAIAAAAKRLGAGGDAAAVHSPLRWRIAGMAAAALLGFAVGITGFVPAASLPATDDSIVIQIEEDAL